MSNTKTVEVPHLGGIIAGYQMPHPYDASKPTLVLVNSFTTSSDLYRSQYENKKLTSAMNLLAIELLGHGQTRTKSENFTYWDTAIMNLQVMEALGVKKAFVLGTSQGGWITVRMALLAPDRVIRTTSELTSPCTDLGTDRRHYPPRHLVRLRIGAHSFPRLLEWPFPTDRQHRRLDLQQSYARFRAGGRLLQFPHRHWLWEGL